MSTRVVVLVALLALAPGARAQSPEREARAALAEVERLRGQGKLGAARARLQRALARREGMPPELAVRLTVAQDTLLVTAGLAYLRGEPCDFLAPQEQAARPLAGQATAMIGAVLERLVRLKDADARAPYLEDPALAPLRAMPLARCIFSQDWGRPLLEALRAELGLHLAGVAPPLDAR